MEHDPLKKHSPDSHSAEDNGNGGNGAATVAKKPSSRETAHEKSARLLARMDGRAFSWYHVKAILISGAGFFTDAYDLFIISIVSPMIGVVYFSAPPNNGILPRNDDLWIKGMALAGTLLGQVFFGLMGDYLGRKKVYLHTLLLMIFSTVAQAMSANTVKGIGVVAMMSWWRLALGFGIGGDYPLSACISGEYANKKNRGTMIATVFSMQGFGIMTAAAICCILLAIFQNGIRTDIYELDYVWRLCIGLGAVPAALTIYARAKLPETPRYTMQVTNNLRLAEQNIDAVQHEKSVFKDDVPESEELVDRINWKDFHEYVTQHPRNWWVLFGTCSTWFFLDIAYYAQNLFLPNILSDLGWAPKMNIHDPAVVYTRIFDLAKGQAIVTLMGTFPGYFFTIALVEKMGRKTIQLMGFFMMTVFLLFLAIFYNYLRDNSNWGFLVMYAFTFFFANFGPNTTTFIIPAEVYPTKYRSTCHGLSAASGKAGAIVGAFGFGELAYRHGTKRVLFAFCVMMFMGLLCTYFVPETRGKTLEEVAAERALAGDRVYPGWQFWHYGDFKIRTFFREPKEANEGGTAAAV